MKPVYRYIAVALLPLMASGVYAQQPAANTDKKKELNKEITLEKDFVPVEKKAVKKDKLPAVRKAALPKPTTVSFAEQPVDITVPAAIPTMMPYGYRTAHNFNRHRGYFDVAGGSHMNFSGSLGYRVIDNDTTSLALWYQHNSTWRGYNATPMISDQTVDGLRLQQKYNDNLLGVDFGTRLGKGSLNANLRGHFDSFNYYGGRDLTWDNNNKQSFTEVYLSAGWNATATLGSRPLDYRFALSTGHSGYDKSQYTGYKGGSENVLGLSAGATVHLNNAFAVSLDARTDYTDWNGAYTRTPAGDKLYQSMSNYWVGTITPMLSYENDMFRLSAGVKLLLGNAYIFRDHGSFHANPEMNLDVDLTSGLALFANITGGRTVNCLNLLSPFDRYSDPAGNYAHSFTPFNGKLGFHIGPFNGFSAKLFGGYGITRGSLSITAPYIATPADVRTAFRATTYGNFDTRGCYFGIGLNYKYRQLLDFAASLTYAPSGDDIDVDKWNRGFSENYEGSDLEASFRVGINPIKRLTIDLGCDLRTGRSYVQTVAPASIDAVSGLPVSAQYVYVDMKNFVELHIGATYRLDRIVSFHLQAGNLLNRTQDVVPGMGAQKLNVMAGVGLVF